MTLRRSFAFIFTALACTALVSQANAGTVTRTVTFDGASPGTFFTADITVTGSLSMSAAAQVDLGLGTVVSSTIAIPNQTFPINQVATVSSTPSGNMTIQLPDTPQTFGGAFPNLAGALTEADIPQLDVALVDSAGVGLLSVAETITGSASIDVLGLTSINFPLQANLGVDALMKDVIYSQTGNAILGPGAVTNPNPNGPPGSVTTAYEIPGPLSGGVISTGTASLGAEAFVSGDINVDLGIFGSFGANIPSTSVFDDTVPIDTFALLMDMLLTDLEPTLFGAPRDVEVDIDGNFDLLGPLSFSFANSGTVPLPTTSFPIPIANLGFLGSITLDGSISGSLTFSLLADITIDNLQYGLQDDVVPDLLVPEPSSIMLVVMGLVALMPVVAVRRRKR